MKRREFIRKSGRVSVSALAGASLLSSCFSSCRHASGSKRYNVLFITVDDLTQTGIQNHTMVKTPNIDRLAQEGIYFQNAYCQSPICIPSRTSFLSGLRPQTTRVYRHENLTTITDLRGCFEPGAFRTLPEHFKENGYFTARVGKIYHAAVPNHIGTDGDDDPPSWIEKYNPVGKDRTEDWCRNMVPVNGKKGKRGALDYYMAPNKDEGSLTDAKVADQVISLLEKNKNKPFFIGAGFYLPHPPFIAPEKYFYMYPIKSIPLYGGEDYDVHEDRKDIPFSALTIQPPFYGMSKQNRKEAKRAYYASTSYVDAQVGRVLDALERLGLKENTIVVLLGDHGWMLGEHGLYRKHTPFEEAAKAPLIISGPGLPRAVRLTQLVEFVNLYPTLLDLCHLPSPPQTLEGYSMDGLLRSAGSKWDRPAYTMIKQYVRKDGERVGCFGYSVRTQQYRYTEWTLEENKRDFSIGRELYDHTTDPLEQNNLAFHAPYQYEKELEALHTLLWQHAKHKANNK